MKRTTVLFFIFVCIGCNNSIKENNVQEIVQPEVVQLAEKEASVSIIKKVSDTPKPELIISGIMFSDRPTAFINNQILGVGDKIYDYEIIEIKNQTVIFKNADGVLEKEIREDKGIAKKQYQMRKQLESLPLYVGFQVENFNDLNQFELASDEKCSTIIHQPNTVDQNVFARAFVERNDRYPLIRFYLVNRSEFPIELNYTADEFYSVDRKGNLRKIDLYSMREIYPGVINPGEEVMIYREQNGYFKYAYGKSEDIVALVYSFDYGKRKMLFKKCPSALF